MIKPANEKQKICEQKRVPLCRDKPAAETRAAGSGGASGGQSRFAA